MRTQRFSDDRGFFSESWNKKNLAEIGIKADFVLDSHSWSSSYGIIRGMHFQVPPFEQAKIVRCGKGKILDVCVDIRRASPTYLEYFSIELSRDNGIQLFIPEGFMHGFKTLEPDTEVFYKSSNYYNPKYQRTVRFDDPQININWGAELDTKILSEKDGEAPCFSAIFNPF